MDYNTIIFQHPESGNRIEISYKKTEISSGERGSINDLQSKCIAECTENVTVNSITTNETNEGNAINITDNDINEKVDKITGIEEEQKERLKQLLYTYRDVFKKIPGKFKNFEYKFEFKDKAPYFHKSYPVPLKYIEKGDEEIDRMLRFGVIERARSEFINPIVTVIKKNGTVRLCIDGRELNMRLVSDHDGPEDMVDVFANMKIM